MPTSPTIDSISVAVQTKNRSRRSAPTDEATHARARRRGRQSMSRHTVTKSPRDQSPTTAPCLFVEMKPWHLNVHFN